MHALCVKARAPRVRVRGRGRVRMHALLVKARAPGEGEDEVGWWGGRRAKGVAPSSLKLSRWL